MMGPLRSTSSSRGFGWRFQAALLLGWIWILVLGLGLPSVQGMRFVLDKKECFQHHVEFDGDRVHASFVIIKVENSWSSSRVGVDLTVDAHGERHYSFVRKDQAKFDFIAPRSGFYTFCFSNQSPMHETVDFDVYVGHEANHKNVAKAEHVTPLMRQISDLGDSLYSVKFELHWLTAQTVQQASVNEALSRRVLFKSVFESLAMIGASFLQVYLLRRLFEKRLGKASRV